MSLVEICGISDRGLLREENQDAIMVDGLIERKEFRLLLHDDGLYYSKHGLLCAVADGLGGHQGGATASMLVLEALSRERHYSGKRLNLTDAKKHIEKQIQDLHELLIKQGQSSPDLYSMGTTLTGVYLNLDYNLFFHVGDSRLYRFRGDFLMQLTKDHSLENITQQVTGEPETGAKSGTITNCIGGGISVKCEPEIAEINYVTGDTLLICSDGLSDMLALEKIEETLSCQKDLALAAYKLVDSAKDAGGHDNISVILIGKR